MVLIEFDAGAFPRTLTARSKANIRDFIQGQELAKFLKRSDLVGYTPNPLGPDDNPRPWPFPWPGPPWWNFKDPDPQPNISNLIQGELFLEALIKSNGAKDSLSVIDTIKREGIASEALKELSVTLSNLQKSVEQQIKLLG
ncbi:hypothetical protein [Cellulophaga sp. L1A9]|uniref:hypothetical protein n=1 Tax=Cellulophaga sp. L1A9 TaxID=2686362 RepID=UPI00131D1016|nr:hypothetical protein [Cellulophaga sp. L1A9]